ncbi:DEBR0S6_00650g1_1 [Brettanomyces bruxellensis]|uniref:DEBR0S6_00650g1_1 n=1 Tax=Dekkera bruxellensis TaxID=5007 RepID=A0A7D9H287_DEKBR|nr:DEBR0S6_00650g1_1 [Brettanomyces bruxellensis]
MPSDLQQLSPEPFQEEKLPPPSQKIPGIQPPGSHSGTPLTSRIISSLSFIQKYSILPFAGFSLIHLSSVVVLPALFGVDAGNEAIDVGRELYQTANLEPIVLGSVVAHVASGVLLNILRKLIDLRKHGIANKASKGKKKPVAKPRNNEGTVNDVNEGLGGVLSILGFSSIKSITYRWFGVSPLSFSGYVLIPLLAGHVLKMRVNPLLVDGDSSYVDLSYMSYALSTSRVVFPFYVFLVFVGAYHMVSGSNRLLGLFSRKARKVAYIVIYSLLSLSVVSLVNILRMPPVVASMAERFSRYIDYI